MRYSDMQFRTTGILGMREIFYKVVENPPFVSRAIACKLRAIHFIIHIGSVRNSKWNISLMNFYYQNAEKQCSFFQSFEIVIIFEIKYFPILIHQLISFLSQSYRISMSFFVALYIFEISDLKYFGLWKSKFSNSRNSF